MPWITTQQQRVHFLTLPGTGCKWNFLLTLAHHVLLPCNPGHHSRKTITDALCQVPSPGSWHAMYMYTLCAQILEFLGWISYCKSWCLCVINTGGFHFQSFCPSHSQDSSSIYCYFSWFTLCPRKPVQLVFQFLRLINFSVTKPGSSLLSGSTILSSSAKLCNRINHTRMNRRTIVEYALFSGLTADHYFFFTSNLLD